MSTKQEPQEQENSLIPAQQNKIVAVTFDSPLFIANKEDSSFADTMNENLDGGVQLEFPRIKIPSGGGLFWTVPGEEETPYAVLNCIIVDKYRVNSRWEEEEKVANKPPLCFALDAKTGIGNPGGECAKCQFNQWGSSVKGQGKACKNIMRVFVLLEGSQIPHLLALSPMSLDDFDAHMVNLLRVNLSYYGVSSKIRLYKRVNKVGQEYSAVAWSKGEKLTPEERNKIKEYIRIIKPFMRELGADADDYNTDAGDVPVSGSGEPY